MIEEPGPEFSAEHVFLADRFGLVARVLILVFLAAVLAAVLPIQLLNAGWQYRFTGALTDNAPVALLGLALIHLAVHLDPQNPDLHRWRTRFGGIALAAAFAFLLLIPLQGWVLWKASSATSRIEAQQLRIVNREINALLSKVQKASSTQELLQSLPPRLLQTLDPPTRRLPLTQLRDRLERDLIQARTQLTRGIQTPANTDVWTLWRRSLRVIVSALAYAVGFSAFALFPGTEVSMFREWQMGWRPWKRTPDVPLDQVSEPPSGDPP